MASVFQAVRTVTTARGGATGNLRVASAVGMGSGSSLAITDGTSRWTVQVLNVIDSSLVIGRLVDDRLSSRAQMDLSLIPAGATVNQSSQAAESVFQEPPPLSYGPNAPVSVTLVSITVTPADGTVVVGNTQQMTAMGQYSNLVVIDITASVAWSSDHPEFVSIDSTGLTTGEFGGVATITATMDAVSGSTTMTAIGGD